MVRMEASDLGLWVVRNPASGKAIGHLYSLVDELMARGSFADAEVALGAAQLARWIFELSSVAHRTLFPVAAHARYVAALAPLREAHPDRSAPELLALAMLGEYLELDPVALAERRAGAEAAAEARWRSCVPNDCDVRPEQLDAYYSGEALETSCHLPYYGQRSLATALRVRLAMLAAELGAVQMVDFGGGAGVVPHLALSLGVSSAVCIEANRGEIDFARWRERTFGFPRAMYLHPSMASSFAEEFDFAVCTEVLEHVLDVPALVRELYALLRPGGILFVTSSFGLYPHPGHLPRNICYAGRETDLMVSHGFEPCEQPSFGLPLLNGWGFYRRPEGS